MRESQTERHRGRQRGAPDRNHPRDALLALALPPSHGREDGLPQLLQLQQAPGGARVFNRRVGPSAHVEAGEIPDDMSEFERLWPVLAAGSCAPHASTLSSAWRFRVRQFAARFCCTRSPAHSPLFPCVKGRGGRGKLAARQALHLARQRCSVRCLQSLSGSGASIASTRAMPLCATT